VAFVGQRVLDTKEPSRSLRNIPCFGEREPSLARGGVNACEPNAFGQFLSGLGVLASSPWDNQTTYDLLIDADGRLHPTLPTGTVEARARNPSPDSRPEFNDRTTIDLIAKRIDRPRKFLRSGWLGSRDGSEEWGSASGLLALADPAGGLSQATPHGLRVDRAAGAARSSSTPLGVVFTDVRPRGSAPSALTRVRRCNRR